MVKKAKKVVTHTVKKARKVKLFRGMRYAERLERQVERTQEKFSIEEHPKEWLKFLHSMRAILETVEMDVREELGPTTVKEVTD